MLRVILKLFAQYLSVLSLPRVWLSGGICHGKSKTNDMGRHTHIADASDVGAESVRNFQDRIKEAI